MRSTFGQLGPDEVGLAGSIWRVGDDSAGKMILKGSHFIGFDDLRIGEQGEVIYEVGGTLTDKPLLPPALWTSFYIANSGKFEIAEGQAVSLTGGWYEHGLSASVTTFRPNSSLSIGRFDGSLGGAPDYSFSAQVGKIVAYERASISTTTDMKISDVELEFWNPGKFERAGVPGLQTSTLTLAAKDGMMAKNVLIENTKVKFLDWNPEGRYTSTTQVDAQIVVDGKIELKGTTELHMRVNVSQLTSDRIAVMNPAGSATLTGNQLSLKLKLKNLPAPAVPGPYPIPEVITAPSIIAPPAPADPFGGGTSLIDAPAGWTVSAATVAVIPNGQSIRVTVTKAP